MRRRAKLTIGTLAIVWTLGACSSEETAGAAEAIEDDRGAWDVTRHISSMISDQIVTSRTQDKTWSNEVVAGTRGSVTINGSYDHTEYTSTLSYPEYDYAFNNVTLSFDGYSTSEDADGLVVSGTATVNGTLHETSGSAGSTYSGGWTLSGNFMLSGEYSDEISLTLTFREDSMVRDFQGTLTTSSAGSYSVSPDP